MVQKAVKIQTKQTIRANLTLELTHMNTSHKSIYLQTRSAVLVSAAFGVHRPVTIDVRRFFRDKAGEPPSRKTACSSLCVIAIPPHQFSSTQLCPSKFKEKTSNEKNSVRHMMNTNKELPWKRSSHHLQGKNILAGGSWISLVWSSPTGEPEGRRWLDLGRDSATIRGLFCKCSSSPSCKRILSLSGSSNDSEVLGAPGAQVGSLHMIRSLYEG